MLEKYVDGWQRFSRPFSKSRRFAYILAAWVSIVAASLACGIPGLPTSAPPITQVVIVTEISTQVVQVTEVVTAVRNTEATPTAGLGTVTGLVTFGPGDPARGMAVQLTDLLGFTATSDTDGRYTLSNVPSGPHTIMARSSGFGSSEIGITVRANGTTVQDLRVFTFIGVPTATPTTSPGVSNWTGTWVHNFGMMTLNQSGSNITGTYHNAFSNGDGTVQGTVSGNVFDGTWFIFGGSGSIHWVLSPDGQTFDGNWNGSSAWCGARSGVNFPAGCSFAGTWTNYVAGNSNCSMNLTRHDNSVTGTYCNGSISGTVSYTGSGSVTILTGTWNSGGTGTFTFYLLDYNAMQFQGNWDPDNYWCGWRSSTVMPSPCLR